MKRRIYGSEASEGAVPGHALPVLERHHVEALERIFPPRCMRLSESQREHDQYAGMSALTQRLREAFEAAASDDGQGDDLRDAERAK